MDMEMTLPQKIEWVRELLSGQHSLWNRNVFYIPARSIPDDIREYFWEIIEKFKREGLVRKAYLGFGGLFNAEHKPGVFKRIGKDGKIPKITVEDGRGKFKTTELLPTYYIEIDETKLSGAGKSQSITPKNEVEFDSQNSVISFGKIVHAFQKGRSGQLRLKLFRALWDKRKVIKGDKVRPKGELFPASAVAVQLGLIDSPRDFDKNFETKDAFDALLKNTERTLQKKKIPIRIYQKGGVQIVVKL